MPAMRKYEVLTGALVIVLTTSVILAYLLAGT